MEREHRNELRASRAKLRAVHDFPFGGPDASFSRTRAAMESALASSVRQRGTRVVMPASRKRANRRRQQRVTRPTTPKEEKAAKSEGSGVSTEMPNF
ncbi:MAG: hypothetical protein ACLQNE_20800 [Thermoguttaceae bacterium]